MKIVSSAFNSTKRLGILIVLSCAALWPGIGVMGETSNSISFSFSDQHKKAMVLEPEFDRPMIVAVADKNGSEQLIDWIEPLTKEFGRSVDFFAIADLRAVPGPLKGLVRRSFRKQFEYNIAMDWDGIAVKTLSTKPDIANLILLDRKGTIVTSMHGEASKENLAEMIEALQKELKKQHESKVTRQRLEKTQNESS